MSNAPYSYEFINRYNSMFSPSTVHCRNTGLVNYYIRYLIQKIISVFEFKGIPENWALNYMQYCLICFGRVAILDTPEYGVIPQECGLGGFDVFYQPAWATIANPLLKGLERPRIGEGCEIIKLQPDYGGAMDLISTYADLMALCLETAGVNLLNSKLSYVFAAGSKTQAEAFKKMYDKIASGEPAVFVDKSEGGRADESLGGDGFGKAAHKGRLAHAEIASQGDVAGKRTVGKQCRGQLFT